MAKIHHVTHVRYVKDYRLEVAFTNGVTAEVDLRGEFVGRPGMLGDLENLSLFRRVRLDPEIGSLVWPNGVDICPVLLYSLATRKRIATRRPA